MANRDTGVIERIAPSGEFSVRLLESEKTVAFDPKQMRHFDHGYAMTSYSAQGLTAGRVLLNIDSNMHPDLINSRLAYVSVSRAEHDAQVYTNDASRLSEQLSRDVTKTSALQAHAEPQILVKESPMSTNQDLPASIYAGSIPDEVIQQDIRTIKQGIAEHTPPAEIAHNIVDQHWRAKGKPVAAATHVYAADLYQSVAKHPEYSLEQHVASMQPMAADRERWEPLIRAVPIEIADSFQWTGTNGTVQSYQHESTLKYVHVDGPSGQFFNRDKNPIHRNAALEHALPPDAFLIATEGRGREQSKMDQAQSQSYSL